MSEELDVSYKVNQVGPDATELYNNGKVREVFALAALGNVATIETVEGELYIVVKQNKFEEILNTFAEKQDVKIEYKQSEGINPQVDAE